MNTLLIVGLGNPGKEYALTRHNAGFMLLDYFWRKNRENFSDWEAGKKIKAEISLGKIGGRRIILAKPQTFMNLSGQSVSAAKKYYKVKLENIFVIHDEIDLPLGTFRFCAGASSAGHKGAQNIIDALGTKKFTRIRIGIDSQRKPDFAKASVGKEKIPTEKYVLGRFSSAELKVLKKILGEAANELLEKIIK